MNTTLARSSPLKQRRSSSKLTTINLFLEPEWNWIDTKKQPKQQRAYFSQHHLPQFLQFKRVFATPPLATTFVPVVSANGRRQSTQIWLLSTQNNTFFPVNLKLLT
jgi:hypothetical protein